MPAMFEVLRKFWIISKLKLILGEINSKPFSYFLYMSEKSIGFSLYFGEIDYK